MANFTTGSVIVSGWKSFRGRFGFYLALICAYIVAHVILSFLAEIDYVGWLITMAGQLLLAMGLIRVALVEVQGGVPKLKQLFTTYEHALPFLGGVLLYTLTAFIGFLLFIIPGIVIAMGLQFFTYFIIDKNLSIRESLRASWDITSGYKMRLFGLALVLWLINVAGALLFGVGLIVTIPLTALTMAHVYVQLLGKRGPVDSGQSKESVVGSAG